jgi:hypothetical protein
MRYDLGRIRWCAIFVLAICGEGVTLKCFAQTPDPVILIQGVEQARLQIPPSRLHIHVVFRDPLRSHERDHVLEFDGDRRRSLPSPPQNVGLFYDGSQVCRYIPSNKQASFRDIADSTSDTLFDPRTLGLSVGLGWNLTVSDLLPYKQGTVEMVGKEQVHGIDAWHVRILLKKPFNYSRDLWIGDTDKFPVYRYEVNLENQKHSIISFYDNKTYPSLPSRVECSSSNTNGTLRFGLVVTITKAEQNVAFPEANWTLAGLNLPVGTEVMDRRTKLTIGYWNGTNVTPFEVWAAGKRAKNERQIPPKHSKMVVWIFLCASAIFPIVILWKGMSIKTKL